MAQSALPLCIKSLFKFTPQIFVIQVLHWWTDHLMVVGLFSGVIRLSDKTSIEYFSANGKQKWDILRKKEMDLVLALFM